MRVENERKTSKRLIKLAKKDPNHYTEEDVKYAKLVRKANKKSNNENLS